MIFIVANNMLELSRIEKADVRNRTGDLRFTKALLYHLSYIGIDLLISILKARTVQGIRLKAEERTCVLEGKGRLISDASFYAC